jgi:DNA-binding NarL/FixJ family response regulator
MAVRGWAAKMQHQGRRHTFSLQAQTQAGAEAEAQELYAQLRAGGWEAVDRFATQPSGGSFDKTDVRYWQERLLIRKGSPPGAAEGKPTLCAHIDHAGTGYYFPLGTDDSDAAASKALVIYQTVLYRGWRTACQMFPREVCLAFHWSSTPLLWTYTNMQTAPLAIAGLAQPALAQNESNRCFFLAEADPGIRRALAWQLTHHLGWRCVAVSTIEAVRAQCEDQGASLCLINAELQNRTGLPMPSRLTTLTGSVSALAYSVHADSDAAFVAPQGGLSNYLYKRLPLDRLLEPIQTALNHEPVSFESLRHAAQSYFRSVLNTVTDLEPASASVLLTPREQQVLGLLCKGHVDKEIAAALGISPWTVRGHLKHVFAKLQVRSRIEAMLWSGAK